VILNSLFLAVLNSLQNLDLEAARQHLRLTTCDRLACKQLMCVKFFPACNLIGSAASPVCVSLCRACYGSCTQDTSRTTCGQMHASSAAEAGYSSAAACSLGLGNISVAV
jgi:hypothetical protein